jgi:hypothetical protein
MFGFDINEMRASKFVEIYQRWQFSTFLTESQVESSYVFDRIHIEMEAAMGWWLRAICVG